MGHAIETKLSREAVRELMAGYLTRKLMLAKKRMSSVTLPELLGFPWPVECAPFYDMYDDEQTAGREMGKLLSRTARELGIESKTEDRRGRRDAITRYYFGSEQ